MVRPLGWLLRFLDGRQEPADDPAERGPSASVLGAWKPLPPRPKLLFIDFDGVMHRAENGSFERIPELRRILDQCPDVSVVISSNWRINSSRQFLTELFPEAVRDRLAGAAPDLSQSGGSREDEVRAFARSAGSHAFAAIDDDASLFAPGCPFLIRTDRHTGIDEETIVECVKRLGGAA